MVDMRLSDNFTFYFSNLFLKWGKRLTLGNERILTVKEDACPWLPPTQLSIDFP